MGSEQTSIAQVPGDAGKQHSVKRAPWQESRHSFYIHVDGLSFADLHGDVHDVSCG